MGIQSFISTIPRGVERPKHGASPIFVGKVLERIVGWSLIPCHARVLEHRWIMGKLVNYVILSGLQTLLIKSNQEASTTDANECSHEGVEEHWRFQSHDQRNPRMVQVLPKCSGCKERLGEARALRYLSLHTLSGFT